MAQFRPGRSGNPKGSPKHPHADGWASAFTGINTQSRDKRLSHSYVGACLPYQEIARLWEKDDITAKAIEAPSAEVFREGYGIEINDEGSYDDLAGEIEERLEEIELDESLEAAWQIMRAFGGSAIQLGFNDNRPLHEPVDPTKPWKIDFLNVFEPIELTPVSNYTDRSAAKYGQPELFMVNDIGDISSSFVNNKLSKVRRPLNSHVTTIHESRLIIFQGIKTSRYAPSYNQTSQFWGTSVVDRFIDQARDLDIGYSSAGLIATDISQPVLTIQGLREMVAKHPQKFRDRMAALELGRSTARALVLGENEKFDRQTTNVSGIPEILDRLSIRTAAAIGIPLSILLGYSPSSLGQPGEVEMKIWMNTIRALQRRKFGKIIKRIARMEMKRIRQRKAPKKWGIEWNELEHLNEMQMAEAKLNQARVDSMDTKSGIIHPDEIRNSRYRNGYSFKTQIDTKKKAPGFMAPLPAGVLPGSTPAVGGGGGGKPKANPTAHTVTSYARRNPTQTTHAPKAGGDKAPSNRDSVTEVDYARAMLEKAHENGEPNAIITFLEDYLHTCELEATPRVDNGSGEMKVFAGLNVCVEYPKGSVREWAGGSTRMKYAYGYVTGTTGVDGDSVDVYLGPSEGAEWVYVVHQMKKSSFESGNLEPDEDKVMLGFDSPNHAKDAYLALYDDERFFGGMSVMSLDEFKEKLWTREGEKLVNDEASDEAPETDNVSDEIVE